MSVELRSTAALEWARRLARFESSNQSVVDFCESEGVSRPSFYQWRVKLRESPGLGASSPRRFLPVQILATDQLPTVQKTVVRLGGGIQIELGGDLGVIETVVRQLVAMAGVNPEGGESC